MYNYSDQLKSFRKDKIRLLSDLKNKLLEHRKSNRDRLISRIPDQITDCLISYSSFKPQGSMAVDTIIQTKFIYEEYDIDDGLVFQRDDLVDKDGNELSSSEVRRRVLKALKDKRFVKQPKLTKNAIRVFYKEEDEERHHIDIPVYRVFENNFGETIREVASEDGWLESDPTQVNCWFNQLVVDKNKISDGYGTRLRQLIQLLKRFCRSRNNWDMPSGMKLTMLVVECQPSYSDRLDTNFKRLLEELKDRLEFDKIIRNLAHPDQPELTRTSSDSNVENLKDKVDEALNELSVLDEEENNNERSSRKAWDWIFQSDGYFQDYDKKARLENKANLINNSSAFTTGLGTISATTGVANQAHRFYGKRF